MSNYRADETETVVTSDATWLKVEIVTDESAKSGDFQSVKIRTEIIESAVIPDSAIGASIAVSSEFVGLIEDYSAKLRCFNLSTDLAFPSDTTLTRLLAVELSSAAAEDAVTGVLLIPLQDQAQASDEVLGTRKVRSSAVDQLRASDWSGAVHFEIAIDQAVIEAIDSGRILARVTVDDYSLLDDFQQGRAMVRMVASSGAKAGEASSGVMHAHTIVSDVVGADGTPLGAQGGQAWTANSTNWALSRYAPFEVTGIAVIDGVAYAETDHGVFAMDDGATEQVHGSVTTARVRIGKGELVHLAQAVATVAMVNGSSSLEVTTEQENAPQTYSYPLGVRSGSGLAVGRYVLGRGLRGGYFQFKVRLSGRKAEITSLGIDYTTTKRSV